MDINPTIRNIPLSGVIKVFDKNTGSVIFSGTEDSVSLQIGLQKPETVYCVNDTIYIDIHYQKVYYDTEADWYYYESFFRSQYDEHSEQEKHDWYHDSFDEFLKETLTHEPIREVT